MNDENLIENETVIHDDVSNTQETILPDLKPNEAIKADDGGVNVQLSMDPSIAEDEEKLIAKQEHKKKQCAILEGLLFLVGDDGLTVEKASDAMEISKKEVEDLFDQLMKYYTGEERGFEIARYGNTYRFLSKAVVHDAAKRLFQIDKTSKLSNAALETLAIIAYKQPITRVEIEEIRGVGADVMIRKLEARGLIKEDGRSDAPGRPFLYSVTDEFMDAFKLMSLDELPELPEFNQDEEGNSDLFTQ